MDKDFYNASGCPDPMAYAAMKSIQHDEAQQRVNRLIKEVKTLAAENGLVLVKRIEVKDKKSGTVFK
jgi:hypothetical protein